MTLFHIKINGDDNNKDNGFYTLMISGSSVFCLKGEEYIVPEEAVKKLGEENIAYEVVPERNTQNATPI